jgi:hypothetical protein
MQKFTTEKFIERARAKHGDRYIYDKVEYLGACIKIIITCRIHGDFLQAPYSHLVGSKCKKCDINNRSIKKMKTKNDFIKEAISIHGNKYDYSKVKYYGSFVPVCIVCKKHGEFMQIPSNHLNGSGCPIDGSKTRTMTTGEFISKAISVHGDRYIYDKVVYINTVDKVCIICKVHGEFMQCPSSHLNKNGCFRCATEEYSNRRILDAKEKFIKKATIVHGNRYEYSKVNYIGSDKKVCIRCLIHGEFLQTPGNHLSGQDCPVCVRVDSTVTTEEYIEKAKKVHKNRYTYLKTNYTGSKSKICILCEKHGEFWQKADSHLNGRGCQKCALEIISSVNSSNTEEFIKKSKIIHGKDTYIYSKVDYIKTNKKVCITCKKHGDFFQTPTLHLQKYGCNACAYENNSLTSSEFITRAEKVHFKGEYDYSKVEYIDMHTPVCIICRKHGEFY